MIVALDCETFPFGPEAVAPTVVCLAVAAEGEREVYADKDGLVDVAIGALNLHRIVGHNIAYDLACLCATYPQLFPRVFRALESSRVHDTAIREKLYFLATTGNLEYFHGKKIGYSLADLAYRRLGVDVRHLKTGEPESWRLRFKELYGLSAREYPRDAYDYAAGDAALTLEVFTDQWIADPEGDLYMTESLHVKAAFCYALKTAWGLEVDAERKEQIQAEVEAALSPEALPLLFERGILTAAQPPRPYANGAKDHRASCPKNARKTCACPPKMAAGTKEKASEAALHALVERVSTEQGFEVQRTEKGAISTKKSVLADLKGFDPTLDQWIKRAKLVKLKTSYFPALEWPFASGITAKRVHPTYDALKKTGRCSASGNSKRKQAMGKCYYPSAAVQQADPRMRTCYVARPGMIYCACDYSALELVSCAQTVYRLYGASALRDQLNAGIDPHAFLGAVLAFESDEGFRAEATDLSDEDAYALFVSKKESDPEFYKYWRKFAKPAGLGFPGGLGPRTMVSFAAGYGVRLTVEQARALRETWRGVYPCTFRYLQEWVPAQQQDALDPRSHVYTSPQGMRRAGCTYTECANGNALQTPAAEGMKEATFLVTRECYDWTRGSVLLGCKPVVNMHDELLVEIPDDERRHERAARISELMIEGMRKVIRDVKVSAEPVLMKRWDKAAEAVYDEEGRLEVWTPQRAAA